MTKIRAIVLAQYKFETSKEIKRLTVTLLVDDNFTYQDYKMIPSQYIITDLNVAKIFLIDKEAFVGCSHSVGNNKLVFLW